jgi:hypothetical protein
VGFTSCDVQKHVRSTSAACGVRYDRHHPEASDFFPGTSIYSCSAFRVTVAHNASRCAS